MGRVGKKYKIYVDDDDDDDVVVVVVVVAGAEGRQTTQELTPRDLAERH